MWSEIVSRTRGWSWTWKPESDALEDRKGFGGSSASAMICRWRLNSGSWSFTLETMMIRWSSGVQSACLLCLLGVASLTNMVSSQQLPDVVLLRKDNFARTLIDFHESMKLWFDQTRSIPYHRTLRRCSLSRFCRFSSMKRDVKLQYFDSLS